MLLILRLGQGEGIKCIDFVWPTCPTWAIRLPTIIGLVGFSDHNPDSELHANAITTTEGRSPPSTVVPNRGLGSFHWGVSSHLPYPRNYGWEEKEVEFDCSACTSTLDSLRVSPTGIEPVPSGGERDSTQPDELPLFDSDLDNEFGVACNVNGARGRGHSLKILGAHPPQSP